MKWFYRNFVILLIVLIAAIGIMMAICIIGRIAVTQYFAVSNLERGGVYMTANQIEYWKLQETKRHNIEMEEMDKPLKASQTASNYASINLMQEQAKTQDSARAANLASAAASYATATRQYEAAETEKTQQQLNLARTEYTNVQTQAETYQLPVDMYAGEVGATNYMSLHYATPNERFTMGDIAMWNQALGFSGDSFLASTMKGAIAIFQ